MSGDKHKLSLSCISVVVDIALIGREQCSVLVSNIVCLASPIAAFPKNVVFGVRSNVGPTYQPCCVVPTIAY